MEPLQAGKGIIWLDSTESTNSAVKRSIGACDNLSVTATVEQTAGRGQGEHRWISAPGENLTFSMLFRFGEGYPVQLKTSDAVLVTWISTLAVRDYLLDNGIASRIKWPNDIWVGDKKICGMLIENISCAGMLTASISGIGVNLNQKDWPAELPNPVSMSELTGKKYDLGPEMERLAGHLRARYAQAASEEGRKSLEEEFGRHVFRLPSKP